MRDVELYRRPPFLVGDEAAVLRLARGARRRRRFVQVAFLVEVALLGALLTLFRIPDIAVGAGAFAAVSSLFVVLHLAAGRKVWMKPVEAYEDGLAASEITVLFCRRRFVPWKEIESLTLEARESGKPVLRAGFGGGRTLESAPGEVEEAALSKMKERIAASKEAAKAAAALLSKVGGGGAPPA